MSKLLTHETSDKHTTINKQNSGIYSIMIRDSKFENDLLQKPEKKTKQPTRQRKEQIRKPDKKDLDNIQYNNEEFVRLYKTVSRSRR